MNVKEAVAFIKWYKETRDEFHYLASFKSSKPFHVQYPNAKKQYQKAKIVLGLHEYQRTFSELLKLYPMLTKKQYNKKRSNLGIE